MRTKLRILVGFALALVSGLAAAQFEAGTHYVVLEQPQRTVARDGVEVREFFSYMCPYCYTFAGPMHQWLRNEAPAEVRYVRTPVVFQQSWELLARTYYTAEVLDIADQVHLPLFTAIHDEKRRFRSLEDVAAFLATLGVDRERFMQVADSFAVATRLNQGQQAMRNFRISSTPSVVVAGKYLVTPRTAGSQERMVQVIDYLVRQEAAEAKQ